MLEIPRLKHVYTLDTSLFFNNVHYGRFLKDTKHPLATPSEGSNYLYDVTIPANSKAIFRQIEVNYNSLCVKVDFYSEKLKGLKFKTVPRFPLYYYTIKLQPDGKFPWKLS